MSRFRLSIPRKHSQRLPPGREKRPRAWGRLPTRRPLVALCGASSQGLLESLSLELVCLHTEMVLAGTKWLCPPEVPSGPLSSSLPPGFHAASHCEAVCSTPHKLPAGAAGPGNVSKANSPTPLPDVAVPCPGWLPGCRPMSPPTKNQPWACSIRCPPAPPEGPPRLPCSWSPGCEEAE